MQSTNNKFESLIETIQKIINSKSGNSESNAQFLDPLQNFFASLNFE
jgi:hypothetical protein